MIMVMASGASSRGLMEFVRLSIQWSQRLQASTTMAMASGLLDIVRLVIQGSWVRTNKCQTVALSLLRGCMVLALDSY